MKKRVLSLTLAALLAMALAGCGGGDSTGDTAQQGALSNFTPEQITDIFCRTVLDDEINSDVLGMSFGPGEYITSGEYQVVADMAALENAGSITVYENASGEVVRAELSGAVQLVCCADELFLSLGLDTDFAADIENTWAASYGESQEWERDGIHVYYECDESGRNHLLSVSRV